MREYLAIGVFYVLCVAARAIEIAIDAFGFARRARSIVRRSIARSIDRSMRSIDARDLARARERHSCTRTFLQCLPFSLPPSSAASPPSRRPRSKCVFFSLRATRDDARDDDAREGRDRIARHRSTA
jgi:hypothetical protein